MEIVEQLFLGNSVGAWLVALAVTVACFLVLKATQRVALRRLTRFAETTKTDLDDLAVDVIRGTRLFSLLIFSIYAGTFALILTASATKVVEAILIVALLLQGALWGNSVISFLLARAVKERMERDAASATTLSALGFVGKLVMWSIILLLALDNLGVNITALVAGLGVGGIAVALAIQNILGDLFASLSIVLDKPFVIGDFIIVNEYLGTVEHIGLKTTRIRSLSGEQVVFSNADLLRSRIRNFKRMYERRVVFTVGVTYNTSHEKLSAISTMLKSVVERQQHVRFDRAHFKEYGDSSLVYEVVYFVKSPEFNVYMDIQQAINLEIFRRFQEEGIEFAFPTRTLYVRQEIGERISN